MLKNSVPVWHSISEWIEAVGVTDFQLKHACQSDNLEVKSTTEVSPLPKKIRVEDILLITTAEIKLQFLANRSGYN